MARAPVTRVRVAVEVLAGSVVTHCGARIGVAGGNLDIAQVHAGVEHGRDEGVAEHVRVRAGDAHASNLSQAPQAAGGGVAVHPRAAGVDKDRAASAGTEGPVDCASDSWWRRDEDGFGAFAAHAQDPVAVFFAEVGDVGSGGFEDPQAGQAEHGGEREVAGISGLPGCGEQGLELQVGEPERR